eukprot:ANDGO_05550.mRNA.1 hypothetical protein
MSPRQYAASIAASSQPFETLLTFDLPIPEPAATVTSASGSGSVSDYSRSESLPMSRLDNAENSSPNAVNSPSPPVFDLGGAETIWIPFDGPSCTDSSTPEPESSSVDRTGTPASSLDSQSRGGSFSGDGSSSNSANGKGVLPPRLLTRGSRTLSISTERDPERPQIVFPLRQSATEVESNVRTRFLVGSASAGVSADQVNPSLRMRKEKSFLLSTKNEPMSPLSLWLQQHVPTGFSLPGHEGMSLKFDKLVCKVRKHQRRSKDSTAIETNNPAPASLSGDGTQKTVHGGDDFKVLLDGVSADFEKGSLTAIMGPSGSGKTTLLNCISGRLISDNQNVFLEGTISLNNHPVDKSSRRLTGYVKQQDLIFPNMTVKEALKFAAEMRIPEEVPSSLKLQRVDRLLRDLGLEKVKDTIADGKKNERISGGEMKRLSCALELVASPEVLFLDEPTSGLDAAASYNLVRTLAKLAKKNGQTVVTTIHQPSAQIFDHFDTLMLLSEGKVVYYGPARYAVKYFEQSFGLQCPVYSNPADFLIDICCVERTISSEVLKRRFGTSRDGPLVTQAWLSGAWSDYCNHQYTLATRSPSNPHEQAQSTFSSAREGKLTQRQHTEPSSDLEQQQTYHVQGADETEKGDDKLWSRSKYASGLGHQISLLTWRAFLGFLRNPQYFKARLLQKVIIGLIISLVYFQLDHSQAGIDSRRGLMFFVTVQTGVGAIITTLHAFQKERAVVDHERGAKWYSVMPYFIAKSVVELPLQLLEPVLFSVIVYWMTGLNPLPDRFLIFVGMMALLTFLGNSMGLLIAASTSGFETAAIISRITMIFFMLFSGFLVSDSSIPIWLRWIKPCLYLTYAYKISLVNELAGETFYCTSSETVRGICPYQTGDEVLKVLGLDDINIPQQFIIMVAFAVGLRFLLYLSLRFYKGSQRV